MKTNHLDDVAAHGFAILENVLDSETVAALRNALANAKVDLRSQRAGKAFGIRDLLNVVPSTRELANSSVCRSIVEPLLGSAARVVRGIYFDKHKDANWKVAWHQDLTIAVRERVGVDGFGPWSLKAGINHVQPPVSVLQNLLTLRIHLDDAEESNGALRVFPGSHLHGRLDTSRIEQWKEQRKPITCAVKSGGVMVMRPLLLHSSGAAATPQHRRVLHFEYSATDLPGELRWFED